MTEFQETTTAITFSEEGKPSTINYNVPLPGSHTGRRIVELDLGLRSDDYTALARSAGRSLADSLGTKLSGKEKLVPNESRIQRYLSRSIGRINSRLSSQDAESVTLAPFTLANIKNSPQVHTDKAPAITSKNSNTVANLAPTSVSPEVFKAQLEEGYVLTPAVNWAGKLIEIQRPVNTPVKPRIFFVERYGISSFLGDYGMGKTVKTFTLLPGETSKISLRTWQSTSESRENASSIIDSHEQSARERFADKIQNETTDKQTQSSTEEWHVEAEASASWGFGSAKVSGGGSGEYNSGREQFARQAAESVKEHAAEASSKREMAVTSSSERKEESGAESIIERSITNANRRRVLNFVFRELNQEYVTKLHLKDVRIAFTNGRLDSWREVPISGLLGFLDQFVVDSKVPEVAQKILKLAGYIGNATDLIVPTLERVELVENGTELKVTPATLGSDGNFPLPDGNTYYRFKRGPIGQEDSSNPVEGVLLNDSRITMRTDSVIVEALLGQADALDEHEMTLQQAAANKEVLANDRERLVQEAIAKAKLDDQLETIIDLNQSCSEDPVD